MANNLTNPLVSVVMPVYNGERYLMEAVDSVLAQSYVALELIIVDDGSTDSTATILVQLKDKRVRVITTENKGVSVARNTAIEHATGEWLAFLDSDDVWKLDKLERQSLHFAQYDLICGNATVLNERPTAELLLPVEQLAAMNTRGIYQLVEGSHPPMSSVCLRRSTLGDQRFTPGQRFGEDFDLWLRLVGAGARLVADPEPVYQYRVHGASATAQTPDAPLQAADILLRFSTQSGLDQAVAKAARESARHNYYHYAKLIIRVDRKQTLKLARLANHYGASFLKVLMFAIIDPA